MKISTTVAMPRREAVPYIIVMPTPDDMPFTPPPHGYRLIVAIKWHNDGWKAGEIELIDITEYGDFVECECFVSTGEIELVKNRAFLIPITENIIAA